jgi:hypothetical protein
MIELHREKIALCVIQAMTEGGWFTYGAKAQDENSFLLQTHRQDDKLQLNVRVGTEISGIYLGLAGVSRFVWTDVWEKIGAYKHLRTMLIGKKERWDVLIALLPNNPPKHRKKDYFLDVGDDALSAGYLHDFHAWLTPRQELAVTFRDSFLPTLVQELDSLMYLSQSASAVQTLQQSLTHPEDATGVSSTPNKKQRQYISLICETAQENSFFRQVLAVYGNRCAFCGREFPSLQAIRIIPKGEAVNALDLRNGIALCSIHRRAFELCSVTFDEQYRIIVRDQREVDPFRVTDSQEDFKRHLHQSIILPVDPHYRPDTEYIKLANKIRGWP